MKNDTTLRDIFQEMGLLEIMQSTDIQEFIEKETKDILLDRVEKSATESQAA